MHRQADGVGHLVLNFCGVLRRRDDMHVASLARLGKGGLPLEVKMLLTTDM